MDDFTCDVAIIGAGTAGLAAERSARANGATTLLIDETFGGTTCASVGCMPSKLLIAAADAAHAVRRAHVFGIDAAPTIDGAAVMARVRKERDKFVAGVEDSIAKIPDEVRVKAHARFTGPTTLELDDGRAVRAKAVVIATGSSPAVPEMFDAVKDRVLTNETIFDLETLPASVGVIGAGPLGLELAQALVRLGVETMVFDQGDAVAALKDTHVADALHAILQHELPIKLAVETKAELDGDGVRLSWTGESSGERRFDYLLVATGRPPRLKGLGLETTGLELDDHGTPIYARETMQCGDAAIFLAGDADHDRPVLHEASSEGTIAGRNAASFPDVTVAERMVPFSIMFTEPAVAVIGVVPKDAAADIVVGTASYTDQGRAKVMACNAGLVRFYADAEDGRLTGATMAGPGVEHSAHLIAWAIQSGWTATETLALPFYHPTFEEGLKPALLAICHAVHAKPPPFRDDGFLPGT
jgi:pyruvate/2-oxoglutarate dehydrogenase complex dihydrolipoamide dehydrogenase (E3) component